MDTKAATSAGKKPGPKPLQSSNPKTQYLILYNFVSTLLWLVVLGRVLVLVPLVGFGRVYPGVGQFVKFTQTLAVMEIMHSLFGTFLLQSFLPPSHLKMLLFYIPYKQANQTAKL